MTALFSKPDVPKVPSVGDAAGKAEERRRQIANARGRSKTILTPLEGAFNQKKTLLGQ